MAEGSDGSLLVIILDTNSAWWGQRILKHESLLLSQCLDAVMVFANSHLLMNQKNKLAIIATHGDQSHFLYPVDSEHDETNGLRSQDGRYELFTKVDETVIHQVKTLILEGSTSHLYTDCLIAGSLAMALCYIHRLEKECGTGEKVVSRILVIKGSEDNPSQYMNFMNVVFTAQKQNVLIDACVLDNDSGLLQQACDITDGIYLKIPQLEGLLQYLLWVFLPDTSHRDQLSLPPKVQVDYRAACFCHRNLVEIGYVCSVCLSIFCAFSPICSTCHTKFKFLGPPKAIKKKSKKVTS